MKVFYMTTFGNNVFYVRAKNADEAKAHLIEQVKKYFFKRDLAADESKTLPATLGENIIVELGIHKSIIDASEKMTVEDITATAYIFSSSGKEHWKDWDLSVADVLAEA